MNLTDRPAWQAAAACQGRTAEMFPTDTRGQKAAAAICARCPCRAPCLAWALDNREVHGTWGGVSEHERRRIRRRPRRLWPAIVEERTSA